MTPASRLSIPCKGAVIVAAWFVISVAILVGASLGVSWLMTLIRGGDAFHGGNVLIGIVCSLIALLFVGVFHLRKETVQLRVSDRAKFQARMQAVLTDLGYHWVHMTDTHWRTRPDFRALLFGGGLTVRLEGNRASIPGPRISLELVRRRYRMASHLDKVQQAISDSRSRIPETYLKRLELSLRLEPDHAEDFRKKIVEVFAEHGNVLIDVQIMLISEDGIRESLWTKDMKPWLEENKIHYEFRRDHTQRATLGAASGEARVDSFIDTCVWS